jgi:hypothetical protein
MTTASLDWRRLWVGVLTAVALSIGASCSDDDAPLPRLAPRADAGQAGNTWEGGSSRCESHDQPGCPCENEGDHLICGKVVIELHGQTICGKGVSVCTNGRWGECILNNADLSTVSVSTPDGGSRTQTLGPATPCNNVCDPFCITYPDDPSGLGDAGQNITVSDAGLSTVGDSSSLCTPATCASLGKNCGPVSNGCGAVLDCGTCTAPQTCGGAGVHSVCGTPVADGGACTPVTCAQVGANCGPLADGCGTLLNCGICTAPQTCGGAGTPSVCGLLPTTCIPATCAGLGKNCGPVSDGCGGLLNCGTCTSPQTCGGGGTPSVCGPAACVPKTCAQLGATCGPVADGCGGLLSCGTCSWPQTCGGAGIPSKCGANPACTNLCLKQVTCVGNGQTTVTGTVYAPNGTEPLPNAVVYVPNGTVAPFTQGVSCDNCAQASGSPLVGTTSAVDGTFTLTNMPVGTNIPLVIQIGRWRRQVSIPNVASCTNTALPASLTRLPKNQSEGDIPKQAFATGQVDALECVLRKMGVDDSEFTNALGNGRIHLYANAFSGNVYGAYKGGVGPAAASATTPTGTTEWDYRLFDTHAWLMADAMSYSRVYHAAVLLQDGRVLVAGGMGATGTTASATTTSLKTVEIYDPSTNT